MRNAVMPIETIITAAIITVSGYIYNHGMPKNKRARWLTRFLMPWKATQYDHKKIPLMVYVNENYDTAHPVQDKRPDLKLVEK
jgi:hypothetical protein